MASTTKADVERWHKKVAGAAGIMALALARGKRSATMADDVVKILIEAIDDIERTK